MKHLTRNEMKNLMGGKLAPGGEAPCACTTNEDCGVGYVCGEITLPCGPNNDPSKACTKAASV